MKDLTYKELETELADASSPLVVDLHAPWCGFCTKTRPHLERLSEEREGSIRIVGIDTDDEPDAYTRFKVKTLPAIILFKDGEEVDRRGSGDYDDLSAWLAQHGL